MRIIKIEFIKIVKSQFLWLLLVVFCAFNYCIIYSAVGNEYAAKELGIVHQIMLKTDRKKIQTEKVNVKEMDKLYTVYQEYYNDNLHLYDNLDMKEILAKKKEMFGYQPVGFMQGFVENNYEKLQKRVEEIKSTKEYEYDFYPGNYYEIHSFLYSNLGKKLIVEMSLLMVFSLLFIMDYERIHKTRDIVICSKAGKETMKYKILTGALCGTAFSIILCAITFIRFFSCVSFDGLWNVPIASTMVAEKRYPNFFYPFVTFWNVTEIQYFILSIITYLGILVLVTLFTIAMQLMIQNSYFSFAFLSIASMGMLLFASYSNGTFWDLIMHVINPVCLYITSGGWFMENDIILSFAANEFWILGVSAVWIMVLVFCGNRRYSKSEIN